MRATVLLLVLLAGCVTTKPREVTRVVPVPAELTQPVPEPVLEGNQNKDLIDWVERLKAAIREANRRLESIGRIKP